MNMAMQQLAAFSNHGSRSKTPSENSEMLYSLDFCVSEHHQMVVKYVWYGIVEENVKSTAQQPLSSDSCLLALQPPGRHCDLHAGPSAFLAHC